MMLGAMIISTFLSAILVVALIWGLMWTAARWLHLYVALGLGMIAVVFFVQNVLRGVAFCNEDPVFVPPLAGEGGEGRMDFNCDSAGGVLDRLYLYLVGPVIVLSIAGIMIRFWRKSSVTLSNGRAS